jgi:hypothetical protein
MEPISMERKEFSREVEIKSEIGGNNSRRKRNVSGPGSEGEKSLLKKSPDWLINSKVKISALNSCLFTLDEALATPFINVNVIGGASNSDYKFFEIINNSKFVAYIDGGLSFFGLFAISLGYYVNKYCKLREIERNSHYFYFRRLFKTCFRECSEEEIENILDKIEQDNFNDPISFDFLSDTAYFYPPDISKISCWRRRFFATGKARKRLKALKEFLRRNSEKEMLDKLYGIIIRKICRLLNNAEASRNFQINREKDQWIIGLEESYDKKFFKHIEKLIEKNVNDIIAENQKKIKSFTPPILVILMQTSFIYWILVFFFVLFQLPP